MAQDYTHVGVQSLHVLPGAEYHDLVAKVHGFKRMSSNFKVLIGYPLCSTTDDLKASAKALIADIPKERKAGEAVVYMGHGTHHPAGVVYAAMGYILQKQDKKPVSWARWKASRPWMISGPSSRPKESKRLIYFPL
jgi:sirohydrochlorin cobaltochelatase